MHKNAAGKSHEEIIEQVKAQEETVRDFASYVPIGNTVEKLNKWVKQDAKILYLSGMYPIF